MRTARKFLLMRRRSATTPPSPLLTDLVSYWKLDEASGTRIDSHGSNNLTDNNSVGSTAGKIGNAAQFVSANDEFLSSTSTAFNFGTSDFSVSMWVRTALSQSTVLIGKGVFGEPGFWIDLLANGDLRIRIGSATTTTKNGTISMNLSDGSWHHLVLNVNRNGSFAIWFDDVLTGTLNISDMTGESITTALPFLLAGYDEGRNTWQGDMDEVGVWMRLLGRLEITELYGAGTPPAYPFS